MAILVCPNHASQDVLSSLWQLPAGIRMDARSIAHSIRAQITTNAFHLFEHIFCILGSIRFVAFTQPIQNRVVTKYVRLCGYCSLTVQL